jgi:hypothetical protein
MKRAMFTIVIGSCCLALVSPSLSSWALGGGGGDSKVLSGDVNGDGSRSISDAVYLLQFLFTGGPPPVESPEPTASSEVVQAIKSTAARMLSKLPTEEEATSLSPFLRGVYDQLRDSLSAIDSSNSEPSVWTSDHARIFAEKLVLMGLVVPLAYHYGGGDEEDDEEEEECQETCRQVWERCRSACDGDFDCQIRCDLQYVNCGMDCTD